MAQKPRAIFEEVGSTQKAAAAPGGIDRGRRDARGAIRIWLAVLFLLVVAMVLIGGLTRLTDSGLSITEWNPVSGALPPTDAAAWDEEFAKYQASPQYEILNRGMALSEFKTIYWWEWSHRQLGRLVGLVWAAGFLVFLATRRIPPGWTGRLLAIGVLGGIQGAIGWWMVASGLEAGMTSVASYRLAVHLGLAFGILGAIAWFWLRLARRESDLLQARRSGEKRLFGMLTGLLHLTFLQILIGALVAGIDAGRAFPHWPTMDGRSLLPPDPFTITPLWRNFFEDAGLVQFIHRLVAYLILAFAIGILMRARKSPHAHSRGATYAALAMVLVQAVLGIVTAIYSAPVALASLHQLGAVVTICLILRARFFARYPLVASIRGATR
ncbi:heme A synthase [Pseudoroseicyclus sp. CXY001]|uniref:heme A synthase n=1 Tax=Pseudoroseicyclus sp. CXY001 TaxID=3242492 RepID=UPI00358DC3E7